MKNKAKNRHKQKTPLRGFLLAFLLYPYVQKLTNFKSKVFIGSVLVFINKGKIF